MDKDVKHVLMIGNRCGVLREIAQFPQLRLTHVFVLADSLLDDSTLARDACLVRFTEDERQRVCEQLATVHFDLLISNGCPFILPVSELRRPGQLFVNIHPSPLPRMKGKHPINGALLHGEQTAGVTMHFMVDRVDAGHVIHQATIPITPDIDLGLLYRLLFDLEADVFRKGMRKLIDSDFRFQGEPSAGTSSYYSRDDRDQQADFLSMSDDEIVTRVRAFGISSQGVTAELNGRRLRLFDAEPIRNPHVLAKFAADEPGQVLLQYEGRWLIKSRDGIIKVNRGEEL